MKLNPRMRTSFFAYAVTATWLATMMSGCSSLTKATDAERKEQVTGVDKHSSYPALRRTIIESPNLRALIDPNNQTKKSFSTAWTDYEASDASSRATPAELHEGHHIDLTLAWFSNTDTQTPEQKRLTRNSVQERIMLVSNQRCNVFKTYLRREQANTNFELGTATTIFGVLGAVLPGVQASRNLAGMAGITSGVQAEYNQSYFSNLMASVITQGIDLRRNQTQEKIRRDGQIQGITTYSMEAAIRDAISYDGLCSTLTGLEEAQESIHQTTNPGIERAVQTMTSIKAAYEISQGKLADLESDGSLDKLLVRTRINTSPLAASFTPKGSEATPASTAAQFAKAKTVEDDLQSQLKVFVASVDKAYAKQYGDLKDKKAIDFDKLMPPAEVAAKFEKELRAMALDGRGFAPETPPSAKSCRDQISAAELDWKTAQTKLDNTNPKDTAEVQKTKASLELTEGKAQALFKKIDVLQKYIHLDMERVQKEWGIWMGNGSKTANLWSIEKDKPTVTVNPEGGKSISPPKIEQVISKDLSCNV